MLVGDLWTLLDGGEGDYRLIAPRTHPLDPMDRASHKVRTSSYFLSLCVSFGLVVFSPVGRLDLFLNEVKLKVIGLSHCYLVILTSYSDFTL